LLLNELLKTLEKDCNKIKQKTIDSSSKGIEENNFETSDDTVPSDDRSKSDDAEDKNNDNEMTQQPQEKKTKPIISLNTTRQPIVNKFDPPIYIHRMIGRRIILTS
jgi:hypothetical protein